MKKKLRNIWKNFFAPFALVMVIISSVLVFYAPVKAQSTPSSGSGTTSIQGSGISDVVHIIGSPSQLPSFETTGHSNAAIAPGASGITSAIYYAEDFVKYIIGTIAVITIVISGVRLVTAGRNTEEEIKKQKEHLLYAIIGLIIIMVADPFIKTVFFGQQGEVFSSQANLQAAAQAGSAEIRGIYEVIAYICGALAILMIVVAGFRYMSSGGNEENMEKAKRQIIYAVIGLLLVGIAEFAVKDVLFPQQGATLPDIDKTKLLIVNITNFIAGFLSTIAAVMYIYAGYLYVTAFGNEEATGKAKKVIIGATVGLLLAMAAFAIVNTTVKLENQIGTSSSATPVGTAAPASLPTSGKVGS